uniref:60S ribosomal protein L34 n=1 Tax=Euplotes harpa TaxID=151035 RepID=A0A7S3J7T1_9SPIT|mmetsp:Transcript_19988/g.23179  ORF Transcript_19988/g.23179 Transcript_19988/m.23179 type:complete len:146 (+) Transcript_19988:31-468(+)
MGSDHRIRYLRKQSWNTASNKFRKVKTPGRRITIQYTKKKGKGPQDKGCGGCPGALAGIPHLRPSEFRRLPHRQRTVSRPYGGTKCHKCVKERIVRAFLIEEAKLMKKLTREKEAKSAPKKEKKKKDDKKKETKKKGGDKKKGKK